MEITLRQVFQARARLGSRVRHTPLEPAPQLGPGGWLKLENQQRTRSFKLRGALNAIASLAEPARKAGVITASAGNHAQGLAAAGQAFGVAVTTVMPRNTPAIKVDHTRESGATIVLWGEDYDAAEAHARQRAREQGLTFISAYNDPWVVAGQGTVMLEVLADLPAVARVVVPVGGGGLVAGVGLVAKAADPNIQVIGVQSVATPAMYNALKGTALPQKKTLAEGLAGEIETGSITLDLARRVVDEMVLVEEAAIREAIRWMLEQYGQVVEGAGAVGVAAVRSGGILLEGRPTVIIISGGNVDTAILKQLMAGENAT